MAAGDEQATAGGPQTTQRRRRPATRLHALAACAAALALSSCEQTAIRARFVGPMQVPGEADALQIDVSAAGETTSERHALDGAPRPLEETLTLLPGARMKDEIAIAATALRGGAPVARGDGRARFRSGEVVDVEIALSRLPPDDAGQPGPQDGGPQDAGPRDAGLFDAGRADGGAPEPDAGAPDVDPPDAGPGDQPCDDEDGDGYGEGRGCLGFDCDEDDVAVHQGAPEACDGQDQDCDFIVDEGCPCAGFTDFAICGSQNEPCQLGVQLCQGTTWPDECLTQAGSGEPAPRPEREICENDVDEDCDGIADDGC